MRYFQEVQRDFGGPPRPTIAVTVGSSLCGASIAVAKPATLAGDSAGTSAVKSIFCGLDTTGTLWGVADAGVAATAGLSRKKISNRADQYCDQCDQEDY